MAAGRHCIAGKTVQYGRERKAKGKAKETGSEEVEACKARALEAGTKTSTVPTAPKIRRHRGLCEKRKMGRGRNGTKY